ncbi:DUF2141 domain-containing protein [Rubripirellula reticaptiva]|uniref:DUF2141 domain-containing protein n=1 Tax=Rubripirellula reticaptiva TaxID=2528013 RepID=A0A5C6F3Q6_9BACT|nr:DUF2141 domain-containing protein [Rubripirellula reticaptiva]TWU55140.1 hypothetical protein Poly59_14360 [Rubripirellula reticaptiva]
MTEQPAFDSEPKEPNAPPSIWQENHGNLLLGFAAIVAIVGALILLYSQNRFIPVRFPDGDAIIDPESDVNGAEESEGIYIDISGAANETGVMRVALYETQESFNNIERAFLRSTAMISEGNARVLVPFELVPERFAVAAFHDENENGLLDLNRFDVPVERYGFSLTAKGLAGPPSYQDAVVERPKVGKSIRVSIR